MGLHGLLQGYLYPFYTCNNVHCFQYFHLCFPITPTIKSSRDLMTPPASLCGTASNDTALDMFVCCQLYDLLVSFVSRCSLLCSDVYCDNKNSRFMLNSATFLRLRWSFTSHTGEARDHSIPGRL
jgi:hypothetical protein